MRFLFSFILILCGISGMAISFLSEITVTSSLYMLDGRELSLGLGAFSIIVLINGVYNLFSTG